MYLTIFGKPRYLGLVTIEDGSQFEKGDLLLVESSRGVETAIVAGEITDRQESLYRSIDSKQDGQTANDSGLQNIAFIRKAIESDLSAERENRIEEDNVLVIARQVLSRHDLDMKLVDVEYMIDRKKLFLYFTSDQRVDFRAYVRDLAREFRTRIELRQIGVRDEAKVVKGLGACGRICCCSYWLQRFMPIGIKMVKEQNLALNPAKISGLCGRLMCCMSYEQENYHKLWARLPSHGAKIKTEQGTWVLAGVDLSANSCTIHGPEGNVCVNVDLYQKFKETVQAGGDWNNEDYGCDEKGRILDKEKYDEACLKSVCPCAQCVNPIADEIKNAKNAVTEETEVHEDLPDNEEQPNKDSDRQPPHRREKVQRRASRYSSNGNSQFARTPHEKRSRSGNYDSSAERTSDRGRIKEESVSHGQNDFARGEQQDTKPARPRYGRRWMKHQSEKRSNYSKQTEQTSKQ